MWETLRNMADDTYDVIAFDGGEGRRVYMRFRGRQQV
jgi:hypothetical protein